MLLSLGNKELNWLSVGFLTFVFGRSDNVGVHLDSELIGKVAQIGAVVQITSSNPSNSNRPPPNTHWFLGQCI